MQGHPDVIWSQQLSLATKGDSVIPFLYPCPESQNHVAEAAKFSCLLELEHAFFLTILHLHQLSVFSGFLHCLSLAVLELTL